MQEAEGVRLNLGQRYRRHTVRLTRFNFPHENLSLFNASKFVINAYTRICSQILDHEISWFHLRSITISKKLFIQLLCEYWYNWFIFSSLSLENFLKYILYKEYTI